MKNCWSKELRIGTGLTRLVSCWVSANSWYLTSQLYYISSAHLRLEFTNNKDLKIQSWYFLIITRVYIYIYIYKRVSYIQSASEDSWCGLFAYRIYEGFYIHLWECSMYSYSDLIGIYISHTLGRIVNLEQVGFTGMMKLSSSRTVTAQDL